MDSVMRWILRQPVEQPDAREIARQFQLPAALATMACERAALQGLTPDHFLGPKLKSLPDPFLLPGMQPAVELLLGAVVRNARITLFGDYDVDGVTSLTILSRFLQAWGVEVACFLPERLAEGYGLSAEALERCINTTQPQVIIAMDCGTNSVAEIAATQARGIDMIVIDHHEPSTPATSVPIVNPKLGQGHTDFCTAGLAFKFCHALLKQTDRRDPDLRNWLDLVALGTVADLAPLTGENRILVHHGLKRMPRSCWPGLQALMKVGQVGPNPTTDDVGFRLGPRINAAGRLGTAEAALELLTTDDARRARTIADELNNRNTERQRVERATLREAEAALDYMPDPKAIVLANEGWHPGVVGIVASRIMRRFHRPTFVIAVDENGMGKGSGRSIDGVSLIELLQQAAPCLEQFGGHHAAAGLSIRAEQIDTLRQSLAEAVTRTVTPELLQPSLRIDAIVRYDELHLEFLEAHEQLQPYGAANAQPLFAMCGVRPAEPPRVMKEKHLSFRFGRNGGGVRAIWFDGARTPLPAPPWDVAFQVGVNEYRGNRQIQVTIRAIRTSSSEFATA